MINPKVEVRDSGIEGKGLFATDDIDVDEVVWEQDDESTTITKEELELLDQSERNFYYQTGKDSFVRESDQSDYMNHSCDPNTWWEGDTKLVARKKISKGDELMYDYATADINPEQFPGFDCQCGSDECRGYVSYKDHLEAEFQKKYAGHLPSWTVESFDSADKSAVILVFNSKGDLALQLRSATDSKYPHHWDFSAAGGIEEGEDPQDAAQRELKEEIGIDAELQSIGEILYQDEKGKDYLYLYRTTYDGSFESDGVEVEKVEFFSLRNIKSMLVNGEKFHPEFPFLWEKGIIKHAS